MIVKRIWVRKTKNMYMDGMKMEVHGWFLFGILPIYVKDYGSL